MRTLSYQISPIPHLNSRRKECQIPRISIIVQASSKKRVKRSTTTSGGLIGEPTNALEGVDINVGMKVNVKFENGVWYAGELTNVVRMKDEDFAKIKIVYEDGQDEECYWPDKDIVFVGKSGGGG